jgi:glutaredoxin-like protein
MGFLNEEEKEYLRKGFRSKLKRKVELLHFTYKDDNSAYLRETRALLEELSELNDLLTLTVKDCYSNKGDLVAEGLELCPSIKIKSDRGGFMNFYGAPAGYEFGNLVEDIIDMGSDNLPLSPDIVDELSKIDKPVDIKVFITASCPYCGKAVRTAHLFSLVNGNIRASMVDAHVFPSLAMKYNISSVPHIIINDKISFVGALPEDKFLAKIKKAIE